MSSAVMHSPQWPVLPLGKFVNGTLSLREGRERGKGRLAPGNTVQCQERAFSGLTYRLFVIDTAGILWPLRRVTSLRSRT
jgi:hypothetical protein